MLISGERVSRQDVTDIDGAKKAIKESEGQTCRQHGMDTKESRMAAEQAQAKRCSGHREEENK